MRCSSEFKQWEGWQKMDSFYFIVWFLTICLNLQTEKGWVIVKKYVYLQDGKDIAITKPNLAIVHLLVIYLWSLKPQGWVMNFTSTRRKITILCHGSCVWRTEQYRKDLYHQAHFRVETRLLLTPVFWHSFLTSCITAVYWDSQEVSQHTKPWMQYSMKWVLARLMLVDWNTSS